jgi:hypothetical protein
LGHPHDGHLGLAVELVERVALNTKPTHTPKKRPARTPTAAAMVSGPSEGADS